MKKLLQTARLRLKDEIAIIQRDFSNVLTELTVEEKAVIYWYTENGYESINHQLRNSKGQKVTPLGQLLDIALSKLPMYNFIVYRGLRFSELRLERYKKALDNSEQLIEFAFTSTSINRYTALKYGEIILRIFSKNGKLIENISKFGINSPFNEKEVLFTKKSYFIVLGIKQENNNHIITLEEI